MNERPRLYAALALLCWSPALGIVLWLARPH